MGTSYFAPDTFLAILVDERPQMNVFLGIPHANIAEGDAGEEILGTLAAADAGEGTSREAGMKKI